MLPWNNVSVSSRCCLLFWCCKYGGLGHGLAPSSHGRHQALDDLVPITTLLDTLHDYNSFRRCPIPFHHVTALQKKGLPGHGVSTSVSCLVGLEVHARREDLVRLGLRSTRIYAPRSPAPILPYESSFCSGVGFSTIPSRASWCLLGRSSRQTRLLGPKVPQAGRSSAWSDRRTICGLHIQETCRCPQERA